MCDKCFEAATSRRGLLLGLGMGLAAGMLPVAALAAAGPTTSVTPDQALEKLKAGNARYVSAPEVCTADVLTRRASVVSGQQPWATIISCADSRVPPELLFGGVGPGELFIARNAGNMVDTATMGTIEYGAGVLGVPLIVVLGHERCGAVAAACDVVTKKATFPGSIGPMVSAIVPAAKAVKGKPGDFVDNAIRESAMRTARKVVSDSKIVSSLVKAGKVKVVAGRYDLDNGKVDFL